MKRRQIAWILILIVDVAYIAWPFELTEYLGLALVWFAFAITVPLRASSRSIQKAA